jgi:hypothetical protein
LGLGGVREEGEQHENGGEDKIENVMKEGRWRKVYIYGFCGGT